MNIKPSLTGASGRTGAGKDLLVISLIAAAVLVLAVLFDAQDSFIRWLATQQGPGGVGKAVSAVLILVLAFAVFSYRRWREIVLDIQDRKLTEETLRESEERCRRLIENARDMVYRMSLPNGRYEYVSAASIDLFGYSPEEFYSSPMLIKELIHPDWKGLFEEQWASILSGAMPPRCEYPIVSKNGETRWMHERNVLVRGENGRLTAIEGIVTDVTEHKQADEALIESKQQLEDIINFLPDATFVIDKEGKVIAWNRAIEELTGIKADDMMMKSNYEYSLPFYGKRTPLLIDLLLEDLEEIGTEYASIERRGSVVIAELEVPALRGGEAFLNLTAGLLRDSRGNVVGAIESIRDITDRKHVQEALKESEERYRLIFNHAPLGILHFDRDGLVLDFNDKLAEIVGASREKISGFNMLKGVRDSALLQATKDALEGRMGYFEGDYTSVTGGKTTSIRAIYKPVTAGNGTVLGVVGLVEDTSERKRAEEEKGRLEAQLLQAQKMEAVGTLAGGIAHDFNNILTAVVGYTEMALYKIPVEDKTRYNLVQVLKAANRAKELVQQILTFSRQKEQERKPIEVGPILKEALKLLRASLPRTIEIRQNISVPPERGIILADPTQIHQVLMNLCTNAADALTEKGGILEVSVKELMVDSHTAARDPELKEGPYLLLKVTDTGHGIEQRFLERIFEPFFTTKGPGKGTGMGLAVVHGIVKKHGGAITVYSEPGKGSVFNVFLPAVPQGATVGGTHGSEEFPTGSETILFIDDEETLVNLWQQMLEHLGYTVIVRTSSTEALELFRAGPDQFDLVITDMTMPNMTGVELAREMLEIRPGVPIILCSGFSDIVNRDAAKEMGIRELLMKPFTLIELAPVIRGVLDEKAGTAGIVTL